MTGFLDEIEACIPALRRYARGLSHDRDAADDLVQDCLERAMRKRSLFRPLGPVRPWLFRILLNLYRNDQRRVRRQGIHIPLEPDGNYPDASTNQQSRLELAGVAMALQNLPAEQREVLMLVALEGMSYEEASEILEIPTGTVMSRISRARQALRTATDAPPPRLRSVK
ncbi:RNA polymerase sigma factor [Acidisoma cellulosilytica]|uniref:RNA polymerase sigma factor n=1 Tax=Acidisoma cellulosilyticum TaxID=2802395 RepID=A0A964E3D5_9PROT|nr:RNA polymerase sigma factor [Acidisoma cellulosilyticum]MCB8879738.1 RNA polymerase sigma factor [Acidisoma cellulosilyticum]